MTNPSLVFLICNHYIVLNPWGQKVSGEQHYFGSVILVILIYIILLLLLHVLFDLVSVKFFFYLRPASEEGPSSLVGIVAAKVVLYTYLYFVYVSVEVLLLMF